MKKSDINKIDSATAKVEKLQHSMISAPREVQEALSDAKNAMLKALSYAQR